MTKVVCVSVPTVVWNGLLLSAPRIGFVLRSAKLIKLKMTFGKRKLDDSNYLRILG